MEIVEFGLQGIRPFEKPRKFSFKKGLNVVFGLNESGKTTLWKVFISLISPELYEEYKTQLRFLKGFSPRGYIIFRGTKDVYRAMRDFSNDAFLMSKYRLKKNPLKISQKMHFH